MEAGVASWIAENRDVYIGNATAVRDYRVQLRGNKSVALFGIYLALLIGVAIMTYSTSTAMPGITIVDAQSNLRSFYQTTMWLLGLAVGVVAPGLTATSIVMERQRQSIDLVFSAPVSPKYYLVGKMISSFRYTWMVLVLALPITAASVVLGGATWSDVLIAYVLLSLQGLVLTAFALLLSTIAAKPVGAIIWSYGAAVVYNFVAFAFAQTSDMSSRFGSRGGNDAGFGIALSPLTVTTAARTYTLLGSYQVPNWILMAIYTVLVVKICLLGAGSLLNPTGGSEIVGLRIHGLLYLLLMAGIGGWSLWPFGAHTTTRFGNGTTMSADFGVVLTFATGPLILFIPFIACFGFDRERRYRPNGVFALRRIFDGTPGGGLPYVLAMMICIYGGFAVAGWFATKVWIGMEYWMYAFFGSSLWLLFWSIGRMFSSGFGGIKSSRGLVVVAFLVIVAMPFPFLAAVAGADLTGPASGPWIFYVMTPLIRPQEGAPALAVLFGAIMFVASILLAVVAENRTKRKLATLRNYDEQPVVPA